MRTTHIVVGTGLTAAALALPFTLAADTASATGVHASAASSTVRVAAAACAQGGNAALHLTTPACGDRAGGYAGMLPVANDVTLPPVTTTPPPTTPPPTTRPPTTRPPTRPPTTRPLTTPPVTPTSTASPALGVQGGVGGGSSDYGTLTVAVGGTLVAAAAGGGAWYLHRRRTQHRA